ncbi:MAG: carboxylase [Bacteroidales bacterium]|nr:carboxylase [Bacteroidales bacterium]
MATRKLLIRDLTLRDGQQSLFATRMTQKMVDSVLPHYKDANFYAMEVWGGAVPDSVMRYLNEDPWVRLETIKAAIGDTSKLTALSRGRNLFGYSPYPESVIEGFNRNAVQSGIGIMRIFDALNDTNNVQSTIKYVKQNGALADCCICYTVDPRFSRGERFKAALSGRRLPKRIFTEDYFIQKAKTLESLGADMITIKDMAGLVPPHKAASIVKALKNAVRIPLDFHTHCTPGYGLASVLVSIVNGIDIVDTNMWWFAGGPAAPAYELIHIFCQKMGIDTGVNIDAVGRIAEGLKAVREEFRANGMDNYAMPNDFDIRNYKLPAEIDALFDRAIDEAKANKFEALLETTHAIEAYFGFPPANERVKEAEIPGGMYTNMLAQLKQLKLENLMGRTMQLIPSVRVAAGCPPLVTPTSQIVGAQAVNCAIDESKGKPLYTSTNTQFVNLVKGGYGKTPIAVDPEFRLKIAGVREETPYDTSTYTKQPNPTFAEYGDDVRLVNNEKEELLLELFPQVAGKFLTDRIVGKYEAERQAKLAAEEQAHEAERARYRALSAEEKADILQRGLSDFNNLYMVR